MWPMMDLARQAQDYWIDANQRSILFLDALRHRDNTHFDHAARTAPNVLSFAFELVADGRSFERPVILARDVRDRATEAFFLTVYGSPQLQTLLGVDPDQPVPGHGRPGRDLAREAAIARAIADLTGRMNQGGLVEAGLRALLCIDLGRPQVGADERGFVMLRQSRRHLFADRPFSLAHFKVMVREQYLLLLLDEERAVAAIATLLEGDPSGRSAMLDAIRRVADASGLLTKEAGRRLGHVESLFASAGGKTVSAPHGMAGIAAA